MKTFLTIFTVSSAIRLIDENSLWHNLEADWIESRISVADGKSLTEKGFISGKFGTHSMKRPVTGFLVPIPSLSRRRASIGNGCEDFPAFKLLKWKAKSYRKRVKRRQWIAIIERGGCTFMRKILLATKLGAIGAIIIDNDPLAKEPILMRTLGTSIVSASITQTGGETLKKLLFSTRRPLLATLSIGEVKIKRENRPYETSDEYFSNFLNSVIEKPHSSEPVISQSIKISISFLPIVLAFLI